MINYKNFQTTTDVAYNITKALEYCKTHGEDGIVFEKDIYRIKSELASEKYFSVSNHTHPGLKRICFLLDDFQNFTIDGGGSEFIFEDIMIPVAVHGCKNVTIKNFSFSSENTQNAQFKIVDSGENWAEMKVTAGCPCFVIENELYAGDKDGKYDKLRWFVEIDEKTGWLVDNAADYFFFKPESRILFSEKENGLIRMENLQRFIPTGNTLVFASKTRESCSILLDESQDTLVQNVILYSGIGMGVLAQNCENVEINRLYTRLRDNRRYSINADGTHFVHCRGKIHIHDCFFEGQLDDALNVHSIYLKLEKKLENTILAKFGHWETVGIDFIKPGSVLRTVDPNSQLPNGTYTVMGIQKRNLNYLEIQIKEDISEMREGDLLDEVSWKPEVVFENCVVRNNRARGILLASAGKTIIRNNLFQTPGATVLFESNGTYWYESGNVEDVLITENVFDNCRYAKWCNAIIEVVPRNVKEKDRYYNKRIEISRNVFKNCHSPIAWIDNTEQILFKENVFEKCSAPSIQITHCKDRIVDLH